MSTAPQLYAEDLPEGFSFTGPATELTLEMFKGFAELTGDSHPIHYDEKFASNTRFGKPIAHGLLLTALTAMGATAMSAQIEDSMVAMIEQHMEFRSPAFVGDTLITSYIVASNVIGKSRRTARVELSIRLSNSRNETILDGRHVYLLRCRPA
jgi:3-hydroxybutyryl-CoA dehydratase